MVDKREASGDRIDAPEAALPPGPAKRRLGRAVRLVPGTLRGIQLLLLLVVLVPLLLLQMGAYYGWFQTRRATESRANVEMARAVAVAFEGYVRDVLRQELAIGIALTLPQPLPDDQVRRLLVESVREYPSLHDMGWADPRGRVVVSSNPQSTGIDIGDRPYFRQIVEGREWVIGDLVQGRVGGTPTFVIARGMRDETGRLQGVALAAVAPDKLGEVLGFIQVGQGAIAILDSRGWLVYRDPWVALSWEERDGRKRDSALDQALTGEETIVSSKSGVDGLGRMGALVPIGSTGWVASASRPVAEVAAPLVQDVLRYSTLSLLIALMALMVAVRIGRSLAVPMGRLRERALAIGRGELEGWVTSEGPAELEELADAFNRMSKEVRVREQHAARLVEELKEANQQLVIANLRNEGLVEETEGARRRAEELAGALQRERDVLQAIMENTHTQLAYLDPQFNIGRVNSAYARGSGHTKEELLGRNHFDLFPHEENRTIFARVRDRGQPAQFYARPFEYVDQPERGITYWDWTLVPVKDGAGGVTGLVFSLLEVTEGVRARQRIEELARLLEAVLRQMPSGVLIAEAPSGKLILGNRQVEEIWRHPFLPSARVEEYYEYKGFHPDGRAYRPEEWPLARSLRRGEVVTGEEINISRGDGTRGVISLSSAPVRDKEGRIVAGVVTLYDITERKETERFRGEYLALISHDLRNPLTAIKGHADLLCRLLTRQGLNREVASAEAIVKSAGRMNSMIQDLVESARLESGRLEMREEPVDLCHLVRQIVGRVGSIEDQQRLRVETPDWVPPALVDADRIERAIVNLASNGLKYSPPDSPVVLRVEKRDGEILIAVVDQGVGIPGAELPYLFQRFYRAKTNRQSEGLGLGLYITRLIVEAHGGRIWVESTPGKGSSFFCTLPLSSG